MVGKRIKEVRNALDMSQTDFGNEIGISSAAVSKIEKGINNPSEQTIKLICTKFNVNSEWLKDGEDVPMFLDDEETDEEMVYRILQGEEQWKKDIIVKLCKMPQDCWDAVIKLARHLKGEE